MRSAREIAKGPPPETEPAGSGARNTTRFCAFFLAVLVATHLVFMFVLSSASPIWPSVMQEIVVRLEMPVPDSQGPVGLIIALIATLLVMAIWSWASMLAALILTGAAGWELYSQAMKLWLPVVQGQPISPTEVLPVALAVFGLMFGLAALFAGIAYRTGRRKAKAEQSQRAEAMALRIRAQR